VLDAPGYDAATRLLFDPTGEDVPDVPMRPTLERARAALGTLLHLFVSFFSWIRTQRARCWRLS